jgi:hypothetical protein
MNLNMWHSDYNVIAEKVILAMVYTVIFKITYDKKNNKTVIQYKYKNTEKI